MIFLHCHRFCFEYANRVRRLSNIQAERRVSLFMKLIAYFIDAAIKKPNNCCICKQYYSTKSNDTLVVCNVCKDNIMKYEVLVKKGLKCMPQVIPTSVKNVNIKSSQRIESNYFIDSIITFETQGKKGFLKHGGFQLGLCSSIPDSILASLGLTDPIIASHSSNETKPTCWAASCFGASALASALACSSLQTGMKLGRSWVCDDV